MGKGKKETDRVPVKYCGKRGFEVEKPDAIPGD